MGKFTNDFVIKGVEMGGHGSGWRRRPNAKETTDDYPSLDVRELLRDGLFTTGKELRLIWSSDGRETHAVVIRSRYTCVEVIPLLKDEEQAEALSRVLLSASRCNYGGERWWFLCPQCARRVAILYLNGHPVCRPCLQLAYKSQREVDYLRAVRRAKKLDLRLGGKGVMGRAPVRPKGMHWRTYHRLANEVNTLRTRVLMGAAEKFSL